MPPINANDFQFVFMADVSLLMVLGVLLRLKYSMGTDTHLIVVGSRKVRIGRVIRPAFEVSPVTIQSSTESSNTWSTSDRQIEMERNWTWRPSIEPGDLSSVQPTRHCLIRASEPIWEHADIRPTETVDESGRDG